MKTKMKKIMTIVVTVIMFVVLLIVAIQWFFPYSSWSINKSISYKGDPVVVNEFQNELNEFKGIYNKKEKQNEAKKNRNLTIDRVQYILQMYEQPWILSKKTQHIKYDQLDDILTTLKETQDILIDLAFSDEHYQKDTKDFLKMMLQDNLAIQKSVENMKGKYKSSSRYTLHTLYHNLQMDFVSDFNFLSSFYGEYTRN